MTDQIAIRHAAVTDAVQIAAIHCASWRDAYAEVLDKVFLAGPIENDRRSLWLDRMTVRRQHQIVLVADAPSIGLAAFICAYRNHDPQWGSLIDNLHVLPSLRGQHIGEQLMRAAAEHIRLEGTTTGLYLWVFEANQAGLRFYQRLGGHIVERGQSELPAANGAPVLRIFWQNPEILLT